MSSGSSGGSGGGGGGGGSPCGACKFLRRKCASGCVFAPYFDPEQGAAHFAAVHKVFGASNVSKLLMHLPAHKRLDAVVTICYEAQARLRDPVYGCVAHIFALQHQIMNLQTELSCLQTHLATLNHPMPPPPPSHTLTPPPALSISDLPTAATVPATYDLSAIVGPSMPPQLPPWPTQRRQVMDSQQFGAPRSTTDIMALAAGGELQALAHELLNRHEAVPSNEASPSSSSMSK